MYVDEQTYLAHYGVKGMKWGVRKKDNLAVRGVQRIGRTMASGPFGKAGIKAGKKINDLSDFELGNYAFDFEEMESAYYNKTLSELRRKR